MSNGTKLSDLLDFVSDEIEEAIVEKLKTTDLGSSCEEMLAQQPFQVANLLVSKEVVENGPSALKLANSLQVFLKACLGEPQPVSAASAVAVAIEAPRVEVTVDIPKNFSDMTLKEALTFVVANKSDLSTQQAFLERPDVAQAIRLAGSDAIFAPGSLNTIAADKTINCINGLLQGDPYMPSHEGSILLSIGMVLGTSVFQYVHPFDGTKLASSKIDSLGANFDVESFTAEKHEAFVWLQSKPSNVPEKLVTEVSKLAQTMLYMDAIQDGPITTQLLTYFRHAKNTLRDPLALGVNVIFREAEKQEISNTSSSHQPTTKSAQVILGEYAQNSGTMTARSFHQQAIWGGGEVMGSGRFDQAIVVGNVNCMGKIDGTALVLKGCNITSMGENSLTVYYKTAEELLTIARARNVVTE